MLENQLKRYDEEGFLFVENLLPSSDLNEIREDIPRILSLQQEGNIFENNATTLRAIHGSHLISRACDRLLRNRQILSFVENILETKVYLYQFKINFKAAFVGAVWPWHQDFVYWHKEDGMQAPHVVNVAVFLDEVTEFNGPLYLIPKSHTHGLIEPKIAEKTLEEKDSAAWKSNVSAALTYQITDEDVSNLVGSGNIVSIKGPPGSVLFFHGNMVHASAPNISPFNRRMILMTYNSTQNIPIPTKTRRPNFLVNWAVDPLSPI
ncbi:phytanoyl-CoA dioxygenase family protein [Collimonas fungivorans]|uniref:phytanoyl-CoA dioxygenase family protein n=1 Tax=Collimonas fungivorans TaxID=158899 RepID=UPI0009EF4A1F|nr:phytanoyl-CoA dioxygenase family protein [Collimonas fungivorans]